MAFLSKAEFAKLAGVSRQRIYQMVEKKHLTVRPDGKLDTEDRTNSNYIKSKDRPNQEHKPVRKKAESKQQQPDTSNEPLIFTGRTTAATPPASTGSGKKELDKYDLQCRKIEVDTERSRVITLEKRQDLINAQSVALIFSRLYSIDTRELLQIPAKIAPDLTAELGIDDPAVQIRIEGLLEQELYKTLDRSKDLLVAELGKYKQRLIENLEALEEAQLA